MRLPIVHHPDYDAGFPVTHRFPMGKYRALMDRLAGTGLATAANLRTTAPAPARWLDLAHDPAYVGQVLSCSVPKEIEREIGFAVDERVSRRAQLAAAGTLLAARLALENGIA
ncbi:MAG TPA: histone deacetylase, partial [Rhizobiales bacterium]|nr:histone deacetylase [Hyphomicrobiales bacterium]